VTGHRTQTTGNATAREISFGTINIMGEAEGEAEGEGEVEGEVEGEGQLR
jgi:hypothetical protein